jgi:hypothetical protein
VRAPAARSDVMGTERHVRALRDKGAAQRQARVVRSHSPEMRQNMAMRADRTYRHISLFEQLRQLFCLLREVAVARLEETLILRPPIHVAHQLAAS